MAETQPAPVTLGLYCHQLPETDTLRALLTWLRECSYLPNPIASQSSTEQSKDLLRYLHFYQALEASHGNIESILNLLLTAPHPPRITDDLIERLIQSNDTCPQRIRLSTFYVGQCPIEVGYADALPDDYRSEGRRLIQISASPANCRFAKHLPPGHELGPPEDLSAYLFDQLHDLLRACCGHVFVDYAAFRCDGDLPGPVRLTHTPDPDDFNDLFVSMPATRAADLVAEFASVEDWSIELLPAYRPLQPAPGILIRLFREPARLSPAGFRVLQRLRDILSERFWGSR